jgi:hypothetical protein
MNGLHAPATTGFVLARLKCTDCIPGRNTAAIFNIPADAPSITQ